MALRPRLSPGLPLSWRTILSSLRRKAWRVKRLGGRRRTRTRDPLHVGAGSALEVVRRSGQFSAARIFCSSATRSRTKSATAADS